MIASRYPRIQNPATVSPFGSTLCHPVCMFQVPSKVYTCHRESGIYTRNDTNWNPLEYRVNLHNAEWTDHISSPAVTTFKVRKQHTVVDLPSTSDLLKLKEYSEMKMSQLVQQLSVHPTYNIWRELSEIVLSRLVVFNKRRSSQHSF